MVAITRRRPVSARALASTALLLAMLVLLLASIEPLPTWLLSRHRTDWDSLKPLERLQLEATLRTALIQAIAGLAVLLGAMTALRQFAVARLQAQTAVETQYVDAFTRALTQLSAESVTARVAGVYALDRLAASDTSRREPIYDVLERFIREEPAQDGRVSPAAEVVLCRLAGNGVRLDMRGVSLPSVSQSVYAAST